MRGKESRRGRQSYTTELPQDQGRAADEKGRNPASALKTLIQPTLRGGDFCRESQGGWEKTEAALAKMATQRECVHVRRVPHMRCVMRATTVRACACVVTLFTTLRTVLYQRRIRARARTRAPSPCAHLLFFGNARKGKSSTDQRGRNLASAHKTLIQPISPRRPSGTVNLGQAIRRRPWTSADDLSCGGPPCGGPPCGGSSLWGSSLWGSSQWGSSQWGSSQWGSSQWGSSQWGSSQWGSSQWGSSQWGSSQWGSSQWGSSQWGSPQWGSPSAVPFFFFFFFFFFFENWRRCHCDHKSPKANGKFWSHVLDEKPHTKCALPAKHHISCAAERVAATVHVAEHRLRLGRGKDLTLIGTHHLHHQLLC